METPLPSRRITRSQTSAIRNISKAENEESKNGVLKSRKKHNGGKHQERDKPALIDITNGSPIIGLAMESLKTLSSRCSINAVNPGSGESLLRGQVKTLLQKVEEEEGVFPNTPQVHAFATSDNNGLNLFRVSETYNFAEMLNEASFESNQEEKVEFLDKSHNSDESEFNSLVTCQDSSASLGLVHVQVNASTSDEYKDVSVDELCDGMSKISVNKAVKFSGKHTRFVYNSDGELEGELHLRLAA